MKTIKILQEISKKDIHVEFSIPIGSIYDLETMHIYRELNVIPVSFEEKFYIAVDYKTIIPLEQEPSLEYKIKYKRNDLTLLHDIIILFKDRIDGETFKIIFSKNNFELASILKNRIINDNKEPLVLVSKMEKFFNPKDLLKERPYFWYVYDLKQ